MTDFQAPEKPPRHEESATPVMIVTGPTAGGKSGLALELAERLGGWIINADSMQVYRDLRVLTARPGAADEARAPHRLFGVLGAEERCSVGRWLDMAVAEIAAARAAGRLPILVGGTGMYLKALTEGLAPVPEVPAEAAAEATALYDSLGGAAFVEVLAERDSAAAATLPPGDRQRLIRAYAVAHATGRTLADWQGSAPTGPAVAAQFTTVLVLPPREALYAACDARFTAMLNAGALDEVRALLARGLDGSLPALRAVGVRELGAVIRGEATLEQAADKARQATRNYAKRQLTWFRHQLAPDLILDRGGADAASDDLSTKIKKFIAVRDV